MSRRPRRHRKNRYISRTAARFTSPLIAVVLVPVAAAAWAALWAQMRELHISWGAAWPVLAGAAAYVAFQAAFSRPMGLYVFGHELTHAITAWLSGYRVKSLKVSSTGGEVVTSDTNLFVALAPYCVPLYTVFTVLLYALFRRYAGPGAPAAAASWAAFLVGLTFAFHAALTVHALRQRQPDLEHGGVFLSLVVIVFCNGVALALLLKFLFPGAVSLSAFGREWWAVTRVGAAMAWQGALSLAAWARSVAS